jgi:hypothetical protein
LRALSVAAQNAHIKRAFPSFRQVFDAGFAGCWEGELAPNARPYKISIVYHPDTYSTRARSNTRVYLFG